MRKKIVQREYLAENIAALVSLPPVLQRIYAGRAVTSIKVLERGLKDLLPYQLLLGIDQAVAMLAEHLKNQSKILIVGDFDADGATSTALAIRALRSFGAKSVNYLVPNRFQFGYGLTKELVSVAIASYSPSLIITVDNGIANHDGVSAARDAGIDVLVTDHHLAGEILPDANVIINPNQAQDTFPSKHLAGVGVIFYVMLALRRYLVNEDWFLTHHLPEPNMANLLDLVALGTVADLVPLDYNNRILVHQGLKRIREGQCSKGIAALLELSSRDLSQTVAADLGFVVASRLNAAGRLQDMSLGIECLLSDSATDVRVMARSLNDLNSERRSIEQGMQREAFNYLQHLSQELSQDLPKGLCLFNPNWHQGVIGILAARIKDRFNRPVAVFAASQNDELKGSVRSITGLHVRDVLAEIAATSPQLILKFGGHAMAAGLTIKAQDFNEFKERFNDVIARQITDEQLQDRLMSDGTLLAQELSLETALLLQESGPWGQAFPEPIFDDVFQVLEQSLVAQKHLKLRLGKDNKILKAIAFFVDANIWPNHRCEKIHAAYRLNVNEYQGVKQMQLIIDYLEPL